MNHQRSDNWLQDPAGMTAEQTSELQTHLTTCPECSRIHAGWQAAHNLIHSAPEIKAPVGFSARFQASLVERRKLEHRRQARNLGLVLVGATVVTSILLLIRFFTTHSAVDVLSQGIQFLSVAPQRVVEYRYIFAFWLGEIPAAYLIGAAIILLSWTFLLLAIWILALRRIKHQGVTQP